MQYLTLFPEERGVCKLGKRIGPFGVITAISVGVLDPVGMWSPIFGVAALTKLRLSGLGSREDDREFELLRH